MNNLRWYQSEAVQATYDYLNHNDGKNPLIVLPTGAGKTRVISTLTNDCLRRGGRVVVVSHVKELLEQCAEDLSGLCGKENVGIYSAGLNSRDTKSPVIVAGIQSIYKRAYELGPIMAVIVDEAHLVPTAGDGMYLSFLADLQKYNPAVRCIGLTATPFRLDCGRICGKYSIFQDVVYDADIRRLIDDGFLSPVISKGGATKADLSGVHTRGGEYVPDEMSSAFDSILQPACNEIASLTTDRKSVLIFCASVAHAKRARALLGEYGIACAIDGETAKGERSDIIARFKSGDIKFLCNVNVLTTGFDATNVDCVALLRATKSPGLYAQIVGRGLRINPAKINCLVLDYGGNVMRHGPIDDITAPEFDERGERKEERAAPVRECPNCRNIIPIGQNPCAECGYEFEISVSHDAEATYAEILSSGEVETRDIVRTTYHVHEKRDNPNAPKTMRVEYHRDEFDSDPVKEWVCVEHIGYAKQKAEAWWRERTMTDMPNTAEKAVEAANGGALADTAAVMIRKKAGEKFWNVAGYVLGDMKDIGVPESEPELIDENEVPF